jgi:holliday junction DNA helicase RuvB
MTETTTPQADLTDTQYPRKWSEYMGQEAAKYTLRIAANSAKLRGDLLPHLLICSPIPGQGKTALALLTCRASGRHVHMISGALTLDQAIEMFSELEHGDIVFWDEFHKCMDGGAKNAGWMLNYLIDGTLLTPWGVEDVPRVTFIGATTDKGLLLEPIRDRFKIIELEAYSDEEGAAIAQTTANKVLAPAHLPTVNHELAIQVARAASNQPRMMRSLLTSIRDLAVCEEITAPADGSYDITKALVFSGLTADGLTKDALAYLMLLKGSSTPVGEGSLRQRLGVVGNGLVSIERLLVGKGLIALSGRGRHLTSEGNRRVNLLARKAAGRTVLSNDDIDS